MHFGSAQSTSGSSGVYKRFSSGCSSDSGCSKVDPGPSNFPIPDGDE